MLARLRGAMPMKSQRTLEIGPGGHPVAGCDTLDMNHELSPTYTARWGFEVLPIEDCSYDSVFASHVLEHVPWNRTANALREVYRILRSSGVLEIWVPDFEYIVDCYGKRCCGDRWRRDNPTSDPMMWVNGRLFTHGPDASNWHYACFDFPYLEQCLASSGLIQIKRIAERTRGVSHGPIDLGVRCIKP